MWTQSATGTQSYQELEHRAITELLTTGAQSQEHTASRAEQNRAQAVTAGRQQDECIRQQTAGSRQWTVQQSAQQQTANSGAVDKADSRR
jgi:hypothetical protein